MQPSQGKRTKETTSGSISEHHQQKIGGEFKVTPNPAFLAERVKIFDQHYQEQRKLYEALQRREIDITLKDGKVLKGKSFETTPAEIAKKISKKLLENVVACRVVYTKKDKGLFEGGVVNAEDEEEGEEHCCPHDETKTELYDLNRPFEGDCQIELINFDDPQGKTVFWHSSAHIMGAALEIAYGAHLCIGPPLDNGFYYDAYMGTERVDPHHFTQIEEVFAKVVKENHPFQKVYLTKAQALELFKHNPFKVQLITHKIPENGLTTAYRCGTLVDLCTGPHLPSTDRVKAFKVMKASTAYWLGKQGNDDLQRVYGASFPNEKALKEYEELLKEIAKRDHRNIGKHQDLFHFHPLSPGSAFFYPHGTIIYNKLIELIRKEYRVRGYTEVLSPNLYNSHLWMTSGHWQKYRDNMFQVKIEEQDFGVKPMNCPGHCLMFDSILRSYKELPIRFADFGVLHRNEVSGALTGLTRVRRFQQDDAHIFCAPDQIEAEIMNTLDFLQYVYDLFGFEFKLELSTRPENHLGEAELWDKAEAALAGALDKFGRPWKKNPGDGAFYGPKIDIKLYDALKREHQCGTIQLDFNLPIRFNLQYRISEDHEDQSHEESKEEVHQHEKHNHHHESDTHSVHSSATSEIGKAPVKHGFARPVMVHRAILGSVERMIAILCEHTAGKWPFWLSPRQIIICPVSEKFMDYAESIFYRLKLEGYAVEIDRTNVTLNKKIRNAQLAQFNLIAVVGEEEKNSQSVDLRDRDKKDRLGKYTISDLVAYMKTLEPKISKATEEMMKKAVHDKHQQATEQIKEISELDKELQALDKELKLKAFLEGEGYEHGKRDLEVLERVKEAKIDQGFHPNLYRWRLHLQHLLSKK